MLKRIMRGLMWVAVLAVMLLACTLTTCRYQAYRREQIPAAQAAPATGHLVDAGDTRIFVQQMGAADAPAVLFVHGTGAWSELWRRTLQRTADAGFHVIAIDLPPFGFSQKPAHLSYSKSAQGMRIVKTLESLGIARAVLVGHSFGAGPTVEAALLHPDRVGQLIIVDGALALQISETSLSHSTTTSRLMHSILQVTPVRDAVVATFVTNPRFTRKLLQGLIADPTKATDEVVRVLQQPMHVQGTTAAVGRWLPELIDSHTIAASQMPAEYSKLTMPVTLLWGELDSITPIEQAHRLHQLMPQADLVVLDNVGHIPQVEDSTLFNDSLIRALTAPAVGPR
jgi:pimeloyl-ACP methyl ester carboxylesterase